MAKIGLSLSICIKGILKGEIQLEDVAKIVAGTKVQTDEQWQGLIEAYSESYWKSNPSEAVAILNRLREEGKIEQPRLMDDGRMPWLGNYIYWVDSEEEILWEQPEKTA
ncbi:MAG TPA: hypothetical protein VI752_01970 [Candidatus Paceibacterota bacterium]